MFVIFYHHAANSTSNCEYKNEINWMNSAFIAMFLGLLGNLHGSQKTS